MMKEKYYKISKENALRAGLDEKLRMTDGEDILLSEKDLRNITLTTGEIAFALGGKEYVEPDNITE